MAKYVLRFRVTALLLLMVLLSLVLTVEWLYGARSWPWICGALGLLVGYWIRMKLDNYKINRGQPEIVLCFFGVFCGRAIYRFSISQYTLAAIFMLFAVCAIIGWLYGIKFIAQRSHK